MQIQFNYANVPASESLEDHTRGLIETTVGRFAPRLSRIEVHFVDVNGPDKGGPDDKQCRFEARPKGSGPLAVESRGDSFYSAADDAAGKLRRALSNRLERD